MFHVTQGILSLQNGWQLNRPVGWSDIWPFIHGNRTDLAHHLCFEPDDRVNVPTVHNISCLDTIARAVTCYSASSA